MIKLNHLITKISTMPGFKIEALESGLLFEADGIKFVAGSWLAFEDQCFEAVIFILSEIRIRDYLKSISDLPRS